MILIINFQLKTYKNIFEDSLMKEYIIVSPIAQYWPQILD